MSRPLIGLRIEWRDTDGDLHEGTIVDIVGLANIACAIAVQDDGEIQTVSLRSGVKLVSPLKQLAGVAE
jgi:hypothetical protein